MTNKSLYILLILSITFSFYAQNKQNDFEKKLVEHFQKQNFDKIKTTPDSLFKSQFNEKFNVSASNNFIDFDTRHIVVKNPYFSEKYEESENNKNNIKNFPKSFSVIYQNNLLVSLFENGKFGCFKLDNFERDTNFEDKLNTKIFKYFWIINNQLGALSGNSIYIWNDIKWIKSENSFPLKNQPKLFEDELYIIYGDCKGEWGGTVYFYEKLTAKVYFTESTCANSVIKTNKGYEVLAHLGHGIGSSKINVIDDPRKLTLSKTAKINKIVNGEAIGYTDKSNAFKKKLDFYGVQIFSSFIWKNKELFIVNLSNLTFLAEIKNNDIEIVNSLFSNDFYTHNPITSQYGDYTLINLDYYSTGLDREISVIIIKENKIIKLDWNERH